MTNPLNRLKDAAVYLQEVAAQLDEAPTDTMPFNELAEFYLRLKENYEALDKARKEIYKVKDRMDKFVVPEALENTGSDKVRIPELKRSFYVNVKYSASFIDKEAGCNWLRDTGAGDLIQPTVNAGTLAGYCKSLVLDEGIDPPEDIVKFTSYKTTGISKYTPKQKAV